MAMLKRIESNTAYAGIGYMPEYSTTIKSLAISGTGTEVFDLGEDWRLIDNIVLAVVNGVDSATSAVTCNFADLATTLIGTAASQANAISGVPPNATTRFSSASALSTVSGVIKVNGRYLRVRLANGSASAQASNTYIDIRCYSLNP